MAMFRLQHGSIGRTQHRPGAASAYMRYIARPDAASWWIMHVPADVEPDRNGLARWMHAVEKSERANAHLLDTVIASIPRLLPDEWRREVVRRYVVALTEDRIPYVAVIHDVGSSEDVQQPHAHIALRDRSFAMGEKVLRTTDYGRGAAGDVVGSTMWMRVTYASVVNAVLEEAGYSVRVDHRSALDRGIRRRLVPHVSRGTWNRIVSRTYAAA